jgi:DNA-binding HxlR family transcriptional regulator
MDLPARPGLPTVGAMKGYGQFCPVAVASEIFAERWTPLILRELFCGSRRFGDLRRGLPLISRTLLAQRLVQLEDVGVISSSRLPSGRGREYRLTQAGEEFRTTIDALGTWGQRWIHGKVDRKNLDPGLLMWDIHRRIAVDRLPDARVVVRVDFRGLPPHCRGQRSWWLVLDRPDVDLCLKDPGFPVDLVVTADVAALTRVWLGDLRLVDAQRAGAVLLDGHARWVRAFPTWLLLSGFAPVERPRPAHAG